MFLNSCGFLFAGEEFLGFLNGEFDDIACITSCNKESYSYSCILLSSYLKSWVCDNSKEDLRKSPF